MWGVDGCKRPYELGPILLGVDGYSTDGNVKFVDDSSNGWLKIVNESSNGWLKIVDDSSSGWFKLVNDSSSSS